jgi:putative tryptophan/tyrosine transport system substrate-binding protein
MLRREFLGVLIGRIWPRRTVARISRLAVGVLSFAAISDVFAQPNLGLSSRQKVPTIGYLSSVSAEFLQLVDAFHNGLKERGLIAGQNVKIEARFADGHYDQLPRLAAELIAKQVDIFVATGGTSTVVAAKPIVPKAMPLVFAMGGDPVKLGVVTNLARPEGNATGVYFVTNGLAAKQVQLLYEIAPAAAVIGFIVNPNDPNTEADVSAVKAATDSLKQKLVVVRTGTENDFAQAFETIVQERVAALFVNLDPFLSSQREKILRFASSRGLPAIGALRLFATDGGLLSYGASIPAANHLLGTYAARVLRGTRPTDLPVEQSARFEFVINLKTAKALNIQVPTSILLRADQVIE